MDKVNLEVADAQGDATTHELIFSAYIKEAEFLRSEALQCIDVVRRLTVFSTSIAGAALPVLAGLIAPKDRGLTITSFNDFIGLVQNNHLLVQFVCLGVSLTCFAFLRIYLGTFQQIFNFARYFREYLIPAMNQHLGAGPHKPVMHWENWLRDSRSKSTLHVGDADLAAEPILMALYCLLYGALFTIVGVSSQTFPIMSIAGGGLLLLMVALTLRQFVKVLRDASAG